MSAVHLGFYNTATTRTHVRLQFSTHASAGGNVAPNSAFEAADIRIYRAADGAAFSATQRSSANGITMTSPFDSLTGLHDVDIDLADNTDAGFYAAGYLYLVMLAPDETVDGQTLTGVPLAYFEIGTLPVNVTHAAGTAWGSGAITAAVFAANAINAAKLDPDVATEINAAVLAILGTPAGASLAADLVVIDDFVDSIESRLPAALVGGRMDSSVGAMAAAVLTAAAIAANAINASKLDPDVATEINSAVLAVLGTPAAASLAADLVAIDNFVDNLESRLPATLTELTGVPGAEPTPAEAWAFLFMGLRNKMTSTATEQKLHDNAGAVIATAALSDDGTTFERSEFA